MKRFIIGLFLILIPMNLWFALELFSWIVLQSLVLILLPLCYLANSRARELIDRLLKVQTPTLLTRCMSVFLVSFVGFLILSEVYPELQQQYRQEKHAQLAQVEVQTLVESARASFKAKEIHDALEFLQKAVLVEFAPHDDEAKKLLIQVKALVSDNTVPWVLANMSNKEFVAFNTQGVVPTKQYLSDPILNDIFIKNLLGKRPQAESLREAGRDRIATAKAEAARIKEEQRRARRPTNQGGPGSFDEAISWFEEQHLIASIDRSESYDWAIIIYLNRMWYSLKRSQKKRIINRWVGVWKRVGGKNITFRDANNDDPLATFQAD